MKEDLGLNPYYLFSLTPLSLLIYFESLSNYYLPVLSQTTWNIAIWNMVMFLLGLQIFSSNPKNIIIKKEMDDVSELKNHCIIFLIIGLLPTICGLALGMQTLLTGNILALRPYMSAMPLASVFSLFRYPAIVCAIKSKIKHVILIILILCAFSTIMNFDKTEMSLMLITVLVSLVKYPKRTQTNNLKMLVLFIVCVVSMIWVFGVFDYARSGYDSGEYLISTGRVSSTINSNIILPYLYLTTPWTNLQYVMQTQPAHTYGLWAIKPFINYLQIDKLLANQYLLIPRSTFNTYTYITVLFKDFGGIGSGFMSVLLGIMVKKIYYTCKNSTSPLNTAVYALNAVAVLEMFFSNHFFGASYPFTIIIIVWIYKKLFVKKATVVLVENRITD